MMGSGARFHRHDASLKPLQKIQNPTARQRLTEHNGTIRCRAVRVEPVLGDVEPDYANLLHGRLLFMVCFDTATLAQRDAVRGRPPHRNR
jgi:hypothetical protein